MKKTAIALLLLLFSLMARADALAIGQQVPLLKVLTLEGNREIQIGQKSDTVYLINFWATWCTPCKEEMPLLEAFYRKHKSQGFEVIAISMDEPRKLDAAKTFARQFSFPIAHKSSVDVKGLGKLWRLPSTFVIDKEGILRKNGHVSDAVVSAEELDRIVLPLLADR